MKIRSGAVKQLGADLLQRGESCACYSRCKAQVSTSGADVELLRRQHK